MKKVIASVLFLPILLGLAAAVPAGIASARAAESAGEYVDDAAITSKVKAALLSDSGLKSFNISVETYKSVVELSGFVTSEQVKTQAGAVAIEVSGVKTVLNKLIVK